MSALFPIPSISLSPLSVSTAAPALGQGERTTPGAHDALATTPTLATAPTVWSLLDPAIDEAASSLGDDLHSLVSFGGGGGGGSSRKSQH